ncbi:MAG: DEAD/DEAH box helicase [Planctomycetes bacterium]|nr:DEAD/DEAH box helicase [Planctomycetota bacterium]MCG2683850.1 DEAD/DEAH box helicase [Planctomycetales bacterium]
MKFEDLGLAEPLLRAVRAQGYPTTTKIQAAAIPPVLEGRDVLGCAQTGTGKTAAFALPTLQRISRVECRVNGRGRKIRTLVLAPTRELALQICESFQTYGRYTAVRQAAIYGGVGQSPQVRALNNGVDVLIATPGRLLDLMQQGFVDLSHVEVLILDEADRMLDMGFIHDLRRIVEKVPRRRQTLLFSATLPPAIRTLADQWLTDPVDVRIAPASVTLETIRQSVFLVDQKQKLQLLTHWLRETPWTRTLVFTRTKHGADKVVKSLVKAGIQADAFHSNKSQSARQRVLLRFKAPQPLVLVATDIAARGLQIDDVSHVVNFDLPVDADNYIHRIGRTGRAGAAGVAVSFCDHGERSALQAIQRLTRQTLAVEERPSGMTAEPGKGLRSGTKTAPGRPAASASSRPERGKRFSSQRRGAWVRRRQSA